MSSPMMMRMFGFCCCCCAAAGATIMKANDASRPSQMFRLLFIADLLTKAARWEFVVGGRPTMGRPRGLRDTLLRPLVVRGTEIGLLDLREDPTEVVGLGSLQRRELFEAQQVLLPQLL